MNYKQLSRNEKLKLSLQMYLIIASQISPCNNGEKMSYWTKKIEDENQDTENIYDKYSYRSMFDILNKDFRLFIRYGEKNNYTYDIVLKDFDEIIKQITNLS